MPEPIVNQLDLGIIAKDMQLELLEAKIQFGEFINAHEGYAVLLEEMDELWDAVKLNQRKHPERIEKIHKEAIQIGAMAMEIALHTMKYHGKWEWRV